jgi:cell division control protein CDC15
MYFNSLLKPIYRALNLKNGEVVAVKRIKIDDEDILADIMVRFIAAKFFFFSQFGSTYHILQREVELLKAVAHPNVVRYHGFIQKSGYMNIVLE